MAAVAAVLVLARLQPGHLFAAVCLGAALVSPLAWRANFVLAWPALVLVLGTTKSERFRVIGWAIAGALVTISVIANEQVTGAQVATAVLDYGRPYAWCYLVLLGLLVWCGRQAPPRDAATAESPLSASQ